MWTLPLYLRVNQKSDYDIYDMMMSSNTAGLVVNSADPDQMPHSVASDLGLHCLLRSVSPNFWSKFNDSP